MALIFRDQLYEIVSIGDPTLLDGYEAGGFRFGRHIETHLAQREGICRTALNSQDAAADDAALTGRGIAVTGIIDFGRDVTREDGTPDPTTTQLKILADPQHLRLSLFACQQFRRDLIEYPQWMEHPNGVTGFAGLAILAATQDQPAIIDRLQHVYGTQAAAGTGGARIPTAKGVWTVTDRAGFAGLYGEVPAPCDAVYALHNWPELPVGQVHAGPGPMMAAFARFDIAVKGRGGHAAMPYMALGVISATAAIAAVLHELPARRIDPLDPAVLTVTRIQAGST